MSKLDALKGLLRNQQELVDFFSTNPLVWKEQLEAATASKEALELAVEAIAVPGTGEGTNVFIQYKGTDLCADFYCDCGTHLHYDGFGAYAVKCAVCGSVWEMPQMVTMRKVESSRWTPILLEKDENED